MRTNKKHKAINVFAKALSDPIFRMRVVSQKKGKGSYRRRARSSESYS